MKTRFLWFVSVLAFCILATACAASDDNGTLDGDLSGDEDATEDGDSDGDGDSEGVTDGDGAENDVADGDEDGALDLSVQLADGETRAGQITRENELIGGPMAKAKIGDYKLYNSRKIGRASCRERV